jgi:hypothetical protein
MAGSLPDTRLTVGKGYNYAKSKRNRPAKYAKSNNRIFLEYSKIVK